MAYNKPDVDVSFQQETQSPILVTPDLEAVLIGEGYVWNDGAIISDVTYSGVSTTIAVSSINSSISSLVSGLAIIDLAINEGGTTTWPTNSVMHIPGDALTFTSASGQTTLTNIGIPGFSELVGTKCKVTVSCLGKKQPSDYGFKVITGLQDVVDTIGSVVSWNPLAYAAKLAILNSAKTVNVINVSGITSETVEAEIDAVLPNKELYVIAPVTDNISLAYVKTHVIKYSLPENKKERVALYNLPLSSYWSGGAFNGTTTNKVTTATNIKNAVIAHQEKRLVVTFPDVAYTLEKRPIATVKPSFIKNSFGTTFGQYELKAKFASDVTVGGKKYKMDSEITDTVYDELIADGTFFGSNGMVTVKAPVPGYYYNALIAGQTIGNNPEQPFTNLPTGGLLETKGSQDYFTEDQLNSIAEAGVYIMTQDAPTSPIVSRHQMTTNTTTKEVNEYSIIKALDYTAKFARKSVKPYIGRYNITPAYLKLLETILIGVSLYLTRVGTIADMKVLSVKQDTNNLDTTKVVLSVKPLYPSNYIKIVLIF